MLAFKKKEYIMNNSMIKSMNKQVYEKSMKNLRKYSLLQVLCRSLMNKSLKKTYKIVLWKAYENVYENVLNKFMKKKAYE